MRYVETNTGSCGKLSFSFGHFAQTFLAARLLPLTQTSTIVKTASEDKMIALNTSLKYRQRLCGLARDSQESGFGESLSPATLRPPKTSLVRLRGIAGFIQPGSRLGKSHLKQGKLWR